MRRAQLGLELPEQIGGGRHRVAMALQAGGRSRASKAGQSIAGHVGNPEVVPHQASALLEHLAPLRGGPHLQAHPRNVDVEGR